MGSLRSIFARIAAMFRRRELDERIDDELLFHIEMQTEENIRRGMSPSEARRQARIECGGIEQVKEMHRDARGLPFLESLLQDLRFAFRSFRRDPGFTATVLVTLALGIGVGTAIFAVVNAVLLQPLPYKEPDRLVYLKRVRVDGDGGSRSGSSDTWQRPENCYDWRQRSGLFDHLTCSNPGSILFENSTYVGERVDHEFCETLGVEPFLGRCFVSGDARRDVLPRKLILQYEFWKRHFDGDPSVIGRTYSIGSIGFRPEPTTIVGVMPPGFAFYARSTAWFSPRYSVSAAGSRFGFQRATGRLKGGLTLEEAQTGADVFSRQLAESDPATHAGWRHVLRPVPEEATAGISGPLRLLLAASGLVLLIVCLNVAGLVLVRSRARTSELAVRSAIGAGRGRLIRQLVTENAILSSAGGLAGLGLAYFLVDYLRLWIPGTAWADTILGAESVRVDPSVIMFGSGIALVSGVLFGLVPAFRSTSIRFAAWINEGSSRAVGGAAAQRTRHWLSVAQVSLAVVLTVGACLLVRSFLTLQHRGAGFQPKGVVSLHVNGARLSPVDSAPREERTRFYGEFWKRLKLELRGIPGVTAVTISAGTPMLGYWTEPYLPVRHDDLVTDPIQLQWNSVDFDYFQVLGIPLIEGRRFERQDRWPDSGVIISQETARRFWPTESAIGKKIVWAGPGSEPGQGVEVIGVVGDVRNEGVQETAPPAIYQAGLTTYSGTVLIKTTRDADALLPDVVGRLRALYPGAITSPQGYHQLGHLVRDSTWQLNFSMLLLAGLAGLALVVSTVGVYGVLSYTVRQRTREIGLRMAVGAAPSEVLRMVLRQGFSIAATGVVVGIVAAMGLTRFLESLLYGVEPLDKLTFAFVAMVMMAAAFLASYVPARRATKVDPMAALRHE